MIPSGESRILVVMPTYNEALSAPGLVKALLAQLVSVDVLVVDDGSPDGTADLCQATFGADSRVTVVNRKKKMGLGSAYRFGFCWGLSQGYHTLLEMDADGSHRLEDLAKLLDVFYSDASADLVIGSRWVPGGAVIGWPLRRRLLSRFANKYAQLALRIPVYDMTAGFRVYSADILTRIDFSTAYSDGYCFQIDMVRQVVKSGGVVEEVAIAFVERAFGKSKMSLRIIVEAMLRLTWWGALRIAHK